MLWLHASSAARFERSVRDTLDQLKVAGRKDAKADVFQLLRGWLRDAKRGSWLIVLDNADDVRFLLEPPSVTVQVEGVSRGKRHDERCLDYLPACSHGSMLVTTRSKAAALKIVHTDSIVDVKPMDKGDASRLMEKKLGNHNSPDDINTLARSLDFMPLAMAQAAAYIRQRAPRCSVQQYIDKLEKSERSKSSLLDRDEGDLRRDREASNSIILTWQISFEHIRVLRPSAADLLSLMSFFDRQAIPEALLQERSADCTEDELGRSDYDWESGFKIGKGKGNGDSDSDSDSSNDAFDDTSGSEAERFEEDIAMLRSYSFISITTDVATFEMHRLVQLATHRWLKSHGRLERWGLQFIRNLDDAFPAGRYENWAMCEPLFPHAMAALGLKLAGEAVMMRQASLMYNSAWYAREKGAYVDAERMAMRSVNDSKRVLGEWHPSTLTRIANLALTYQNQGRWDEAEKLEVETVEKRKTVLGEGHPETLTSIANLASTYRKQGRLDGAEKLEVEVVEKKKTVLGEGHPETLISIANLASTYRNQGRLDEAEKLEVEVIEKSKIVLGEGHPSTLISMSNLSFTVRYLGRRQSSLNLMALYATMSIITLGAKHPDTVDRCRWKEDWETEENGKGREGFDQDGDSTSTVQGCGDNGGE